MDILSSAFNYCAKKLNTYKSLKERSVFVSPHDTWSDYIASLAFARHNEEQSGVKNEDLSCYDPLDRDVWKEVRNKVSLMRITLSLT